jgi:hypothetical protein
VLHFLNVILHVITPHVITLHVIPLSVVMLSVVMLSAVMLNVVALKNGPLYLTSCRIAQGSHDKVQPLFLLPAVSQKHCKLFVTSLSKVL